MRDQTDRILHPRIPVSKNPSAARQEQSDLASAAFPTRRDDDKKKREKQQKMYVCMYAYLDDDAPDVLDECAGGVGGLHGRRAPDPSPPHILPSHASGSPRCCRRRWCGGPTPNNNRGGALCGVPGRENSAGGGRSAL